MTSIFKHMAVDVLLDIKDHPGSSVRTIIGKGESRTRAKRIDDLVDEGLVEKVGEDHGKRVFYRLTLTEKGHAVAGVVKDLDGILSS